MSHPVKTPKKLIEVALPLDAINAASAREKSIRHGHPSTLHLWWARRPLATARAVIFAQMVNDPSWKWELERPGEIPPSNIKASWAAGRKRLFAIIEDLVKWENTTNEEVLEKARAEIRKSWRETCEINKDHPLAAELFNPEKLPAFHDPFAGGGAIPLEAQRLGLEAYASDLNPVAVLINKAMIEIPPCFAGRPPINPAAQAEFGRGATWNGKAADGLADDVRYYGQWVRNEVEKRIGHLYPKIEVTAAMAKKRPDLKHYVGKKLTVIAWLWARTVKSPNPAFSHIDVPLASSFMLSTKEGKLTYIKPVLEASGYRFEIALGTPSNSDEAKNGTKLSRGANFRCLMSGTPIDPDYIKSEGTAGRIGSRMMAVVAEGDRGRVYIAPTEEQERLALQATPPWKPEGSMVDDPRAFTPSSYGLGEWKALFTERQLVAITGFSDALQALVGRVLADSSKLEISASDDMPLSAGGSGAQAYGQALATYLSFALSRSIDRGSTVCSWDSSPKMEALRNTFGRQAIPMVWDYAEGNPFSESSGNWMNNVEWVAKTIGGLPAYGSAHAMQLDAMKQDLSAGKVISTDPPYYDNVPYADLSDFFYVWLRRALRQFYPELFATLQVPKADELVATSYRHGGRSSAEAFFLDGMTQAMHRLASSAHGSYPITIYYAFKQSETDDLSGTSSTGWETFLSAVLKAGLSTTGTWPMRTELGNRMRSRDSNALASSVVLVCRPRSVDADTVSRRAFIRELNQVLPEALDEMTKGSGENRSPVAPVDLSQAIVGPGMAVFSKYAAVLEADGSPMTVQAALRLINRFLAEDDFDADTQFCLHWFDQFGWKEGKFGDADTLARAKGTAVDGVRDAGVIESGGGVVRLLKWAEYEADWDPRTDSRLPIWEALHQLIRVFHANGESGAGEVLAAIAPKAEAMRQLAYRLYTLCERSGRADDARAYNEIITSWSAIESAASNAAGPAQRSLFED